MNRTTPVATPTSVAAVYAVVMAGRDISRAVPEGFRVIVDYGDREPAEGSYYLIKHKRSPLPMARRFCLPDRMEPDTESPDFEAVTLGPDYQVLGRIVATQKDL